MFNIMFPFRGNPCDGCTPETGRTLRCHSACERYITAKARHVERVSKLKAKAKASEDAADLHRVAVLRAIRRRE